MICRVFIPICAAAYLGIYALYIALFSPSARASREEEKLIHRLSQKMD